MVMLAASTQLSRLHRACAARPGTRSTLDALPSLQAPDSTEPGRGRPRPPSLPLLGPGAGARPQGRLRADGTRVGTSEAAAKHAHCYQLNAIDLPETKLKKSVSGTRRS